MAFLCHYYCSADVEVDSESSVVMFGIPVMQMNSTQSIKGLKSISHLDNVSDFPKKFLADRANYKTATLTDLTDSIDYVFYSDSKTYTWEKIGDIKADLDTANTATDEGKFLSLEFPEDNHTKKRNHGDLSWSVKTDSNLIDTINGCTCFGIVSTLTGYNGDTKDDTVIAVYETWNTKSLSGIDELLNFEKEYRSISKLPNMDLPAVLMKKILGGLNCPVDEIIGLNNDLPGLRVKSRFGFQLQQNVASVFNSLKAKLDGVGDNDFEAADQKAARENGDITVRRKDKVDTLQARILLNIFKEASTDGNNRENEFFAAEQIITGVHSDTTLPDSLFEIPSNYRER